MPDYTQLLKLLEGDMPKRFVLNLPKPLEEIFPDDAETKLANPQEQLLKKNYDSLVASAFRGR